MTSTPTSIQGGDSNFVSPSSCDEKQQQVHQHQAPSIITNQLLLFSNSNNNNNTRIISPIPMRPVRPSYCCLFEIKDSDIICGRGSGASGHKGNVAFRRVIAQVQHVYHYANAVEKAELSRRIVSKFLADGSRFLRRVERTTNDHHHHHYWEELDIKTAREKVCQALREKRAESSSFCCDDTSCSNILRSILTDSNANLVKNSACLTTTTTTTTTTTPPSTTTTTQPTATSPSSMSSTPPPPLSQPPEAIGPNDVLLGRGGVTNCWSGNKRYRSLVHEHQLSYLAAPKRQKGIIARQIVDMVHSRGGRFLEEESSSSDGKWICVNNDKAIEKTKQALREKGPEMKRIYRAAVSLVRSAHSN